MMTHWFDQNVRSIMEKRGMNIKLKLVCVENKVMKPGPVFLEMARVAHAMGADYMYRVNDDTEVKSCFSLLLYRNSTVALICSLDVFYCLFVA